jgi:hypothetical protein
MHKLAFAAGMRSERVAKVKTGKRMLEHKWLPPRCMWRAAVAPVFKELQLKLKKLK